jgi:hypothetical protein
VIFNKWIIPSGFDLRDIPDRQSKNLNADGIGFWLKVILLNFLQLINRFQSFHMPTL